MASSHKAQFLIDGFDTQDHVSRLSGNCLNARIACEAKRLVKNHAFEKAILFLIVINAGWIGVDVDWNEGEHRGIVPVEVFNIVENVFCVSFTLEIILRMLSYESKALFFLDPECWRSNIFDLFLVVVMILEVWVLQALSNAAYYLEQFMVLRLLRLMRLLRMGRILRMVPELGIVVKSLVRAARGVSSTLILEVGIMYIFGVVLTQWTNQHQNPCFDGMDEGTCFLREYFGTIPKSLVTLLQILVFDDTFSLIRPILADSWFMGFLLILFMVIGSWTVLSMLIGVICEIMNSVTEEEKQKILEMRVKEVLSMIDSDGSGTVSRAEFERNGGELQLMKLGISNDIVSNAFNFLDCDCSGEFAVKDFISLVFKLLNPPTSQDIQVLNQKVSEIATHVNIQAFSSLSSKSFGGSSKARKIGTLVNLKGLPRRTGGLSSQRACEQSFVSDSEEVVVDEVLVKPDLTRNDSMSDDAALYELRKTAAQTEMYGEQQWMKHSMDTGVISGHISAGPADNHATPEKRAMRSYSQASTECEHPLAPEHCSSPSLSPRSLASPEIEELRAGLPFEAVFEAERKVQAQEIFEKLQQIVHDTAKVEGALKLVHGTRLWKSSDIGNIDSVLKGVGFHNLPEEDKAEAESLLKDYMALNHHDQPSAQQCASLPLRPLSATEKDTCSSVQLAALTASLELESV